MSVLVRPQHSSYPGDYIFQLKTAFEYGETLYAWNCDQCECKIGRHDDLPQDAPREEQTFIPYYATILKEDYDHVEVGGWNPDFTGSLCMYCAHADFMSIDFIVEGRVEELTT